MYKIKIINPKQTGKILRDLDKKFPKLLDEEMKDTAEKTEKEAKRRAPVGKGSRSGELKKGIEMKKRGKMKYDVTSNAPYSMAVEHGTRPHTIRVKTAKVLAGDGASSSKFPVSSDGYSVFGKEVNHPGSKSQPFMQPAVDKATKKMDKRIVDGIVKTVSKTIKKHNKV